MRTAVSPEGRTVWASRRYDCTCECHGEPVIARLGEVMAHHWAHKDGSLPEGDSGSEPMTAWHAEWQEHWPRVEQEVPVWLGDRVIRRGDVISTSWAVEFQHSALAPEEMFERTLDLRGTGRWVCWVIDAREWRRTASGGLTSGSILADGAAELVRRRGRTSCQAMVVADLGDGEVEVLEQVRMVRGRPVFTTGGPRRATELATFLGAREDDGATEAERTYSQRLDGCQTCGWPCDKALCNWCYYLSNRCQECKALRCVCQPCHECSDPHRLTDGLCWACRRNIAGW